jgi:hypothetical protein
MLTFDAATHTYRWDGTVIPSVTQCLEILNQYEYVNPEVLAAAQRFGTHTHKAIDLFNKGILDEKALDPNLAPYLAGWKKYLRDTGARVVFSEHRVYHPDFRYAGTLDTLASIKGRYHVVDIKSGYVSRFVSSQTAAYRQAMCKTPKISSIDYCVQLLGNGEYKLHRLTDAGAFSLFVSCLNVYRALQSKEAQCTTLQ